MKNVNAYKITATTIIFNLLKNILSLFKKEFIYLCLERGEGREKERDRNIYRLPRTPPTRDLAHNPGMCPNGESNLLSSDSQAGAQSTEPHQPGPNLFLISILPLNIYQVLSYFISGKSNEHFKYEYCSNQIIINFVF